jgi:hypothetical protein
MVQGDWGAWACGFSSQYWARIAVVYRLRPIPRPVAALTGIENALLFPASIQCDISAINSSFLGFWFSMASPITFMAQTKPKWAKYSFQLLIQFTPRQGLTLWLFCIPEISFDVFGTDEAGGFEPCVCFLIICWCGQYILKNKKNITWFINDSIRQQ